MAACAPARPARSPLHVALALGQLFALLAAPQLLWRPRWAAFVDFVGGERAANVYGNAAVATAVLVLLNAFFYALYRARSPAVERFRVVARAWPWDGAPAEAAAFAAVVRRGAALAALNAALAVPLGAAGYAGVKALGYSAAADAFPSALAMAAQLALFIAMEDVLFYIGHRALHHPAVYAHVHKVHHAFTRSVSIAATATHPVEYILSNVLPFVAGPTLAGAHCATIYVWTIFRVGETVFHHSGYDFVSLSRTTLRPPAAPATATLSTLTRNPTRASRP